MSSKKVLILYYSGSTQKMAKAIADAMMIFAEEEPASRSAQRSSPPTGRGFPERKFPSYCAP